MANIVTNRKAYHNYEVLEKIEAGIQLSGTEVKSIRAGKVNLLDCYAQCIRGEIILNHMHISPFEQGNRYNHEPYRNRKILLKKREIERLCFEVEKKHLSLIPLSLYFKRQWVKVELGLCKGRKNYDKRQKKSEDENKRRLAKVMKDAMR